MLYQDNVGCAIANAESDYNAGNNDALINANIHLSVRELVDDIGIDVEIDIEDGVSYIRLDYGRRVGKYHNYESDGFDSMWEELAPMLKHEAKRWVDFHINKAMEG